MNNLQIIYTHYYLIKNARKSYCRYIKYCLLHRKKPDNNILIKMIKIAELSKLFKKDG